MDPALRSARMVEAALDPEVTRHMSRPSLRFLLQGRTWVNMKPIEGNGPLCAPGPWPTWGGKWTGKLVKHPSRVTCAACLQELPVWM